MMHKLATENVLIAFSQMREIAVYPNKRSGIRLDSNPSTIRLAFGLWCPPCHGNLRKRERKKKMCVLLTQDNTS